MIQSENTEKHQFSQTDNVDTKDIGFGALVHISVSEWSILYK